MELHASEHSLGIILLAVDLAIAQEAGGMPVELDGAHAAAQAARVPRTTPHFQQEAVCYRLATRAASAVLRLKKIIH